MVRDSPLVNVEGHISGAGKLNEAGRAVLVIVKHNVKNPYSL